MARSVDRSFWTSLPGVLTGAATLITAGTTAWLALRGPRAESRPQVVVGTVPADRIKAAAEAPATRPRVSVGGDILATRLGGTLVFSSASNWEKMNDGDVDQAAQISEAVGDYGVFAFRDRQRAILTGFTTVVPAASGLNPAAIELSYSTGSEDGPFTPIGTFAVRNGRKPPDGRQVFHFAPVTVRFLKVAMRGSQSGGPYVMGYEFGALGGLLGD